MNNWSIPNRTISLIIPVYNSGKLLPALLKKIKYQSVKTELVIIDSSSTDDSPQIASSLGARVISIPKADFNHGGTRTLAGKEAKGEILVYMTQDAMPADNKAIEGLIRSFDDDPLTGAVYGRQLPTPDATPFSAHLRLFNYGEEPYKRSIADRSRFGLRTIFFSNSFAAYRRSALEQVGWFEDSLICNEDTHVVAKLLAGGFKIAYEPLAKVFHSHNYTPLEEARRYFDIGVFYTSENWILDQFGGVGGEGLRFIKSHISFLAKSGKLHLIPEMVLRNGLKLLFYKLGRNYRRLPKGLIPFLSMHRPWWVKQKLT